MSELSPKLKERLHLKETELVMYLHRLKAEKKASMASFNELIKECDAKIKAIAETLTSQDKTMLTVAFDPYQIEAFER